MEKLYHCSAVQEIEKGKFTGKHIGVTLNLGNNKKKKIRKELKKVQKKIKKYQKGN